MKTGFISDLHLYKDNHSNFHLTDDELCDVLKAMVFRLNRLIILGDFVDLWMARWPTDKAVRIQADVVYYAYPKTIQYVLDNKDIIVVSGNHDSELQQLYAKYSSNEIYDNYFGNGIYATHGTYDFINSRIPKVGRFIAWISHKFIFPLFGENVGDKADIALRSIGIKVFNSSSQIKHAKELARSYPGIKYIVMGHTHHEYIETLNVDNKTVTYINTGKFSGSHMCFTVIDTMAGVKQFKVKANKKELLDAIQEI